MIFEITTNATKTKFTIRAEAVAYIQEYPEDKALVVLNEGESLVSNEAYGTVVVAWRTALLHQGI